MCFWGLVQDFEVFDCNRQETEEQCEKPQVFRKN